MTEGDGRFAWTGALALMLALVACGVADARVTVKAALKQSGTKSRLVVTIANTGSFTASNRPRGVAIKYKRTTYRLSHMARTASAHAARGQSSGWQTSSGSAYNGLAGKRVAIAVRTSKGTSTFQRTVTKDKPPATFTPPGRELKGDEAFQAISKYFVNSRFTDCPQRGCVQEHRYDHCAGGGKDGNWEYHELPALPGTAKAGPYHVLTASQHEDGSWAITYQVTLPTSSIVYSWIVGTDRSVWGIYSSNNDMGFLRGYTWQQPAGC